MKAKILIFTSSAGHLSVAQAASTILKKQLFMVQKVNLFHSTPGEKIWVSFYRYLPYALKTAYKIGEQEPIQAGVKLYMEKALLKQVKTVIKKFQPDLIINTNLFYNPALAKFLDYQQKSIPFLNILTDPWSIHPLIFSAAADFNLSYDAQAIKIGQKYQIPADKIKPIGWLTRPQFYQKYSLTPIRKKLNFKKNVFTLLICGGSEGSNAILKIIPALFTSRKPLQILVVCGHNNNLYKVLKSLQFLLQKISPHQLKLFPFTQELPQFMAVADLVMGKAGPNLLFEAIASQKPFFALSCIAHEKANLKLIRQKKLGFIEENPLHAIKSLKKIVNQPQILNQFNSPIKKERQFNLEAAKKLIQIIKKLLYGNRLSV